jgi:NAD+ kinase
VSEKEIKKVGVVAKSKIAGLQERLIDLLDWLDKKKIQVKLCTETAAVVDLDNGVERKEIARQVDLIIVLGGDGTILNVGTSAAEAGAPLVGINMGNLGFMAEITEAEMYTALESILKGDYEVSRRMLLHCELIRDCEVISRYEALNDFVIDNTTLARMIETGVYLDGDFVIRFRADGLIISSPTGSTAYSLSAGGPIMHPHLEAFVITPICPHTLTYRPLVVNSESTIELVNYATEGESFLTVDGQQGQQLKAKDKIIIKRSINYLNLITSQTKDYFQILNEKLQWGGKRRIKG